MENWYSPNGYRDISVIKGFMKDIKLSLAIYARLNNYWVIFYEFIVRFLLKY